MLRRTIIAGQVAVTGYEADCRGNTCPLGAMSDVGRQHHIRRGVLCFRGLLRSYLLYTGHTLDRVINRVWLCGEATVESAGRQLDIISKPLLRLIGYPVTLSLGDDPLRSTSKRKSLR